ncbi:MAG: hypothetical protein Q7T16_03970 [Candidatus Burarchaeum sp.]|nr:hypothetical protein [Candidatus Burarchaeum sp.]MDO8339787.1 hypothetical protein [Candidatus Burarchaeum sp.]
MPRNRLKVITDPREGNRIIDSLKERSIFFQALMDNRPEDPLAISRIRKSMNAESTTCTTKVTLKWPRRMSIYEYTVITSKNERVQVEEWLDYFDRRGIFRFKTGSVLIAETPETDKGILVGRGSLDGRIWQVFNGKQQFIHVGTYHGCGGSTYHTIYKYDRAPKASEEII